MPAFVPAGIVSRVGVVFRVLVLLALVVRLVLPVLLVLRLGARPGLPRFLVPVPLLPFPLLLVPSPRLLVVLVVGVIITPALRVDLGGSAFYVVGSTINA